MQFSTVDDEIVAEHPDQVVPALRRVQQAVDAGRWAFGYVAYEAAAGLDPGVRVHPQQPGLPLVWFGTSSAPDPEPGPLPSGDYAAGPWALDWSDQEYATRVTAVHDAIAAGEVYQCNLTTRLRAPVSGDLYAYYADLARAQRGARLAYLDLGRWAVLCASPETFLYGHRDHITSSPMKGTAARGVTPESDRAHRLALLSSAKERAENIMIVDLIRNDLSRISVPGSVAVRDLLRCERYPTVWQLTSTVESTLRPGTSLVELMTAMFPCGSITGAPKSSSMALIADVEDSPRGVYCGAIGFVSPQRRLQFGVAIRTVVVDRHTSQAVYGVGSGVTWSSTAPAEYCELAAKARLLDRTGADFSLLETLAVVDGRPRHLDRHLARLVASAEELGFACDPTTIRQALAGVRGTVLTRVLLDRDGTIEVQRRDLPVASGVVTLALDTVSIDSGLSDSGSMVSPRRLLQHKTTRRAGYDAARARHPGADDVVLINSQGQVTETTIASLAVRLDGRWWTPPVTSGCLPGVGRAIHLDDGTLAEREIDAAELVGAELAVISSVRGWRPARLLDPRS